MLKKLLLAVVLVSLVAAAFPADASHQAITKNYIANIGDVTLDCTTEEATGYCLGGASFDGLSGGIYAIEVEDDNPADLPTSGAYRVEPGGSTVDVCFPANTPVVPSGGEILVWIDGVVYWALGQPCGTGQLSQGTTGSITVRHL